LVGSFTVPMAVIGRKDAEVAARGMMCGTEADTPRGVEGIHPVAVTGHVGWFPVERATGVDTACPRFKKKKN